MAVPELMIQEIQNPASLMGELDAGRGVRLVKSGVVGRERTVERPIAKSLTEARTRGWDYWDGSLAADGKPKGWVRLGQFYERDIYLDPEKVQAPLKIYE